ncbi:helix-turn-helix domain-containing protein [Microbacterium oxydans]|uniref:helix-turn-helix domain-containing protein n=1 Tax=Microbacterium oxydans TaxID=82380 RepID=UPI0024AE7A74|nr:helix-turn-helix transcriptional regulator [Microbacterium oxydans]
MADLISFPHTPRSDLPKSNDPEPLWRHLLGDQLRRRRHDREETLTETAEKAGVSPQYLSEVERGLKEPSSEMIAAIAGALDTSLIELTSDVAESLRMTVPPRGAFALAA